VTIRKDVYRLIIAARDDSGGDHVCYFVNDEITPLGSPSAAEHTLAGIQNPLCSLCLNRVAESKHGHRHYHLGPQ
jgi:hypothetical protein